jgi:hypothetical protein
MIYAASCVMHIMCLAIMMIEYAGACAGASDLGMADAHCVTKFACRSVQESMVGQA